MGACFSIIQLLASAINQQNEQPQQNATPSAPNKAPQQDTQAFVHKMPDGDTVTCSYTDEDGQPATTRVRIYAIDCPETAQNFGPEARQIGQALLYNKHVTLHPKTVDRYGRLVADVTTDEGLNYSEYMLQKGAAWHYKAYDKNPHLAQLEIEAKESSIGLWSYARPQPPWDYRRRRREQK